jgi:hypothetical protein
MEIEKRMESARLYLRDNVGEYGTARQVVAYDSDRRKQTLAKFMRAFLNNGDSNANAETKARSQDEYALALDKLAEQYAAAETAIAKYDAAETSFKAAQSLLSLAKTQMGLA